METNDLDSAIEQSHAALGAILKGDPSVYQALYSDAVDVTLGNPFGPYARGRQKVETTLAGAASHYRDGEVTGVELIANYASDDLACIVEVERLGIRVEVAIRRGVAIAAMSGLRECAVSNPFPPFAPAGIFPPDFRIAVGCELIG